jgi:hypothetical protein
MEHRVSNKIDRGVELRAQEIVMTSAEPITTEAAFKQAIRERFGTDVEALTEALASAGASRLRSLRRSTYHLADDDGQGSLFDIPQVIVVTTTDGELVVPKAHAATGHVRQWQKEGQQHHSVQASRFKRFGKDLETVADHDDEIPWGETRDVLADRKRKELER